MPSFLSRRSPMDWYTTGARRAAKGDLRGAAAAYGRAADGGSGDFAAHARFRQGLCFKRLRWLRESRDAFLSVIDSGSQTYAPTAAFSLAGITAAPEAAASLYIDAMESDDPLVATSAAICLGEIREDQGDLVAAATAYERALSVDHSGTSAKAAVSLGRVRLADGKRSEARELFERAYRSGNPEAAAVARALLDSLEEKRPRPTPSRPKKKQPPLGKRPSGQTEAAFELKFPDAALGRADAMRPGMIDAILAKEDLGHLIGVPYKHGPTPDGGYRVYWP